MVQSSRAILVVVSACWVHAAASFAHLPVQRLPVQQHYCKQLPMAQRRSVVNAGLFGLFGKRGATTNELARANDYNEPHELELTGGQRRKLRAMAKSIRKRITCSDHKDQVGS